MTGPRLTFFGGKGGVGKTTCAAAAAVRAASEGARVLVVSTDPAHSLSDAFGVRLGPEARLVRVRGAGARARARARARAQGELHAAELDADRALGRWLAERDDAFHTIASRGTYLDDEDIDRLLSLSFPGVDELVGLIELTRLSRTRPYDEVVVDTAPTGHTLRLVQMPDTLSRLAQVLDDMHEKHRFLASSLGGAWRPDFADQIIDDIAREAGGLRELLSDHARTSFTWVTLPEELPVRESETAVGALDALGIAVAMVVVNRVWPASAAARSCGFCEDRVRAEHRWLREIARSFRRRRILEIPARVAEPRGPEELLALALSARRLSVGAAPVAASPAKSASAPKHGLRLPLRRNAVAPILSSHGQLIRSVGIERSFAPLARTGGAKRSSIQPITALARSLELVLFGGKGGVGKTTTAAAAALALAAERPRDRVLLLSTDPAHSLGDALGVRIGDEPRRISRARAPRNLVVRELDAARAWAAQRDRYRGAIDDVFSSIFRGRMDAAFDRAVLEDLFDLAPPGIDELLALVTITDALTGPKRKGAGFDLVVVDTAPTGHTLRLLALPPKALEWVHALMATVLKYRSVIGLGELASDLTDLAKRLRALIALLAEPKRTAFVAVTRPAALPRLETERLVHELGRLRVPLAAIVANAVTATRTRCPRCDAAVELESAELSRLDSLARASASALVIAPAIHPGPRGIEALARWRASWRS